MTKYPQCDRAGLKIWNDGFEYDFISATVVEKFLEGATANIPRLTKRELFAAMVMQGMQSRPMLIVTLSDETLNKLREQMAKDAVIVADALLAELEKVKHD